MFIFASAVEPYRDPKPTARLVYNIYYNNIVSACFIDPNIKSYC